MKFVCDSCKAKYQIGDEKVAGKTLRMKCRRCGHMIQVAASVTETSVSTRLPVEGSSPDGSSSDARSPMDASSAHEATGSELSHLPPAPRSGLRALETGSEADEGGATVVKASPLFLFESQQKPPPPPPPKPSAASFSRPSSPPRIVPPARASLRSSPPSAGLPGAGMPATGMSTAAMSSPGVRVPARPGGAGAAAAARVEDAIPIRPSVPGPVAIPAHSHSSPALVGGFAAAVAAPHAPHAAQLPTEDWYVGISGVPLGPVRLSILRDKAAQGQVDGSSLVWREGFEEWQPLRKVPGLLELVEEAKNGRGSRATPAPLPAITAPAGEPRASFSGGVPDAAQSLPFNLVRPAGAPAPTESLTGDRPAAMLLGDSPSALGAVGPNAAGPSGLTDASALQVRDPFAAPPGPTATASGASAAAGFGLTTTAGFTNERSSLDAARPSVMPDGPTPAKKKGLHPMVWAFIAMAAAFGGVAAWAVFLRKPEVVYVPQGGTATAAENANANGPAPPGPPTSTSKGDATAEATSTETAGPTATPGGGVGGPKGPLATGSAKSTETAAPIDTSGFGPGPGGPKTADTGTAGGGSGPLSAGEAQGVVAKNTPRVRRTCWDPQVASASSDAPKSVKVTASLSVAPDGSVKSASVGGGNEKHYPGLVSCVQSSVKGWRFPASGEGGTVNVPFSFNAY